MITKTALIAALILGTASVAMASEFDPNLGNRYPAGRIRRCWRAATSR